MIGGLATILVAADVTVPVPQSGVVVGHDENGPVALRLCRVDGTRIVILDVLELGLMLASTLAASGIATTVRTARPQVWDSVRRSGAVAIEPVTTAVQLRGTPALFVDDRPTDVGGLGTIGAWQCRVDIRSLGTATDVASVGSADVLVVGALAEPTAAAVCAAFGVSRRLSERLVGVPTGKLALVSRGAIRVVTPTTGGPR